jgi:hemerythrin
MKRSASSVYGAGSGHANLDRDHDILFDILNRANLGFHDNPGGSECISVELLAYTDSHFEHEEQLMDLYHYPLASAHKQAHDQFRVQLKGLVGACDGSESDLQPLILTLENWFERHIREVDARFAEFLSNRSVDTCSADSGFFASEQNAV